MKLHIKIWKNPGGFYQATCDALPGCRAVGMTEAEVRKKIRLAVHGYVASLHAVRPLELTHEVLESVG